MYNSSFGTERYAQGMGNTGRGKLHIRLLSGSPRAVLTAAFGKLRRFLHTGRGHAAALGGLALCCLLLLTCLNPALAVSVEGDFVGYVSSRQELDSILENVRRDLGDQVQLDEAALSCRMAFGPVEEDFESQLTDRLLIAGGLRSQHLIYVDGRAVCGFETRSEAVSAVAELRSFVNATTVSASLDSELAIAEGIADPALLQAGQSALLEAVTLRTTESLLQDVYIPHDVHIITDDSMFLDERRVLVAGRDGHEQTEFLLSRENGRLTGYEQLETVVIDRAVTEVVKVGTRERLSTGSYVWPVDDCYITSFFGNRSVAIGSNNHKGMDMASYQGAPIYASDGGKVIYADNYGGYGNMLKIEHDNGDITFYAHCHKLLVSEGDTVEQGELIAEMGSTGVSSGVHLHFEYHPDGGAAADPMEVLPEGVMTKVLE